MILAIFIVGLGAFLLCSIFENKKREIHKKNELEAAKFIRKFLREHKNVRHR